MTVIPLISVLLFMAMDRPAADRLFEEGRMEEARAAYETLLAAEDAPAVRAELADRIGLAWLSEGRLWDAETWFSRSIEEHETALAHLHRGQAYFYAGSRAAEDPSVGGTEVTSLMNDAARAIGRALELDETLVEAFLTLGLCERYREKPEAEEAAYRRALSLEPGRPDVSVHLAWRLEVEGRGGEAEEVLSAVAEDERDVGHWTALGRLAAARGEDAAARDFWTRAVLLSPNEPSVYQGLWNSTALRKRFLEFADAMNTVVEAHPTAWRNNRRKDSPPDSLKTIKN